MKVFYKRIFGESFGPQDNAVSSYINDDSGACN